MIVYDSLVVLLSFFCVSRKIEYSSYSVIQLVMILVTRHSTMYSYGLPAWILMVCNKLMPILSCLTVLIRTLCLFSLPQRIGILLTPVVSSMLNVYVNALLLHETDDIIKCLVFKAIYDYVSSILQTRLLYSQVNILYQKLLLRMQLAKLHCSVPIPAATMKQHSDLLTDSSKLNDFLYVLPLCWTTIISFGIAIYKMEPHPEYPMRLFFLICCVIMSGIMTYLNDPSLYQVTKSSATTITDFYDSQYVKIKLALGCSMDTTYNEQKACKKRKQYTNQKYVVFIINVMITLISLSMKNIGQLYSFSNISWMIGMMIDNIKSIEYYNYTDKYISLCECLESYGYKNEHIVPIDVIDKVTFIDAGFGYYKGDLMNEPMKDQKIYNFNYTFERGNFYYIEAPNGIGKSTLLRMFKMELFSGSVHFGSINRNNLSFTDIQSSIFHILQATEYTPQFTTAEISSFKNRDEWLEEQLGITNLMNKDTIEMSGGQKKRVFLYMILTSKATILLLDEILSELSSEETPEVPEGGGWLNRVINVLTNWPGIQHKIIILVGHGLLHLIPNSVINLKLDNHDQQTLLTVRQN